MIHLHMKKSYNCPFKFLSNTGVTCLPNLTHIPSSWDSEWRLTFRVSLPVTRTLGQDIRTSSWRHGWRDEQRRAPDKVTVFSLNVACLSFCISGTLTRLRRTTSFHTFQLNTYIFHLIIFLLFFGVTSSSKSNFFFSDI